MFACLRVALYTVQDHSNCPYSCWQICSTKFNMFSKLSVACFPQYLVTAARDGSIKVWDSRGNIKIIFVGHLSSVNTVAVYPFGPYIMSGSSDCTIRVWSLETADEVDRIDTKQPVKGLGTVVNRNNLYSFGANSVNLWKIEHVHSVFTTVG